MIKLLVRNRRNIWPSNFKLCCSSLFLVNYGLVILTKTVFSMDIESSDFPIGSCINRTLMTNYQFNLKIYKGAFNCYVRSRGRGSIKTGTHANREGGRGAMTTRTFEHIFLIQNLVHRLLAITTRFLISSKYLSCCLFVFYD